MKQLKDPNALKCLIIVCAYNEGNNIKNCLGSILKSISKADASEHFSVLCVDNSSIDETSVIVNNMCDSCKQLKYLKIEHDYLCVSRNSYQYIQGFDYIAYVDGDGFVDSDYINELANTIEETKADIISGPVLEAKQNKANHFWDLFYDSKLYVESDFLIGANMVFKAALLDEVGGFPSIFEVRGDESSLLLRINLSGVNINKTFNPKMITYNNFTQSHNVFFNSQFSDGKRSYQISKIRGYYHRINICHRVLSLLLLVVFVSTISFNFIIAISSFFLSIAPTIFRFRFYYKAMFKRLFTSFSWRHSLVVLSIISSKFIFDFGFVLEFLKFNRSKKLDITLTRVPNVLEKKNV